MKKSMKFLALIALVVGAMGLAACSRPAPPPEMVVGDTSAAAYARGFNGNVYVVVNLSADGEQIESIDVNFHLEDQPWVDRMHPMVVDQIVQNQTTSGINTRNGATVTTDALILAVNTALAELGFEVCGCATCNCAIVIEPPPTTPPADLGPAGTIVYPGPYSASALGWADPNDNSSRTTRGTENIYVQVNFNADHTVIESIYVDFNMETQMFVDMMHPSVVNQIIADQSTLGINVYNMATVTTEALLEAVTEVMDRVGFVQGAAPPPATEPETEPETEPDGEPETTPAADVTTPDAPGETPAATPPAAVGTFIPGAHTGSSNNTYSHNPDNEGGLSPTTLVVEIVIAADGETVSSYRVVSHGESQPWVNMSMPTFTQVVNARGNIAGINTIAGSTYTSYAIREAAAAAFNAARR